MGQILRQRSNGSNEFELKSVQVTSPSHMKRPSDTPPQYTTPRQRYNKKSQQYYCCVSISAVLIVVGTILIIRADVTRARKQVTQPYEEQIKLWREKYQQQFQATKWRLNISPGKKVYRNAQQKSDLKIQDKNQNSNQNSEEQFLNKTVTVPLTAQNFEKQILENTQFFDQVMFQTEESLLKTVFNDQIIALIEKNKQQQTNSKKQNNVQEIQQPEKDNYIAISQSMQQFLQVKLQYLVLQENGQEEKWVDINLGELQIFQRKDAKMASWKSCQFREGGRWLKGACITYKQIDQLCYIVSKNSSEQYVLDAVYGGVGCASGRTWLPYHLHRVKIAPRGNVEARIPVQQTNKPMLTVMHAQDPELFARNVTQGTLVVAESNLEMYSAGMTLLLFGCALSLPLLILAVMWIVNKSQRYYSGKYQYFGDSDGDDSDY